MTAKKSSSKQRNIKPRPFELVRLRDHTDLYRAYTYKGKTIYVGQHSDTVRDAEDEIVESVVMRMEFP